MRGFKHSRCHRLVRYTKSHVFLNRFIDILEMLESFSTSFPSNEDVLGCVKAIMRIQEVYQISARQIANGRLSNNTITPQLNAEHCFEIGFAYYKWENYKQAYGWLMEGIRRLDKPFEYNGPLKRVQVLEFLAWTEYMVTFVRKTL